MSEQIHQTFNIVLVGQRSVGKTSILLRFVDDEFIGNTNATIGLDTRDVNVEIDDQFVTLHLWDTAGSELFSSMPSTTYRRADGLMIVYDCTDLISFEKVQEWLITVRKYAPEDVQIMLIGNKIDLITQRQVSTIEAKNYADKHGFDFIETSAKTSDNISSAFEILTRSILQKSEERLIQPPPESPPVIVDEPNHSFGKPKKCCER
ncbi:Rab1L2, Rab1-like protein [Monocercomonoides exilis]|uniref:Rab1L2, Rab1-like protein n=1 Tax=Monocercomonoides exilis TaxID=2049356 RepID=UPI00355A660C|nr:Rab1L2, Rab1-like protein [Monocercomonoides exilis]|eukprot:MONOS_783.1-p1 / transcript=MONOS_783.1 / gene=MONOS_783 / organism=Monocercomonoides_exilis_PA203 / gene_product=Rab1L2, Rab1-like protein / transcript_product=Rab1L2, Rab1-like protein / location=Mono_scaffold00013:97634-98429(+) / protein_length=206 / sequence_SO=supercontig / SO=protein_coding / is_pseudo=false